MKKKKELINFWSKVFSRLLVAVLLFVVIGELSDSRIMLSLGFHIINGLFFGILAMISLIIAGLLAFLFADIFFARKYLSKAIPLMVVSAVIGLLVGCWQGYSHQLEVMPIYGYILLLGVVFVLMVFFKEMLNYVLIRQFVINRRQSQIEGASAEKKTEGMKKQSEVIMFNYVIKHNKLN